MLRSCICVKSELFCPRELNESGLWQTSDFRSEWLFCPVPGLFVLLAAKRTIEKDLRKNKSLHLRLKAAVEYQGSTKASPQQHVSSLCFQRSCSRSALFKYTWYCTRLFATLSPSEWQVAVCSSLYRTHVNYIEPAFARLLVAFNLGLFSVILFVFLYLLRRDAIPCYKII